MGYRTERDEQCKNCKKTMRKNELQYDSPVGRVCRDCYEKGLPPTTFPSPVSGFWGRFSRPRAKLSLRVEKIELSLGEELKGTVEVDSEEEFDVEWIGAYLTCSEGIKKTRKYSETNQNGETEWFEKEYWDRARLFYKSLKVCDEMRIPANFSNKFPFTFQLPSVGRETYHGVDRNLRWFLWAIMKTRGRRSTKTEYYEILVAKPSTMPKEVVREVVLIPCAYCGGLMPQASLFCPNCGARRKA